MKKKSLKIIRNKRYRRDIKEFENKHGDDVAYVVKGKEYPKHQKQNDNIIFG